MRIYEKAEKIFRKNIKQNDSWKTNIKFATISIVVVFVDKDIKLGLLMSLQARP